MVDFDEDEERGYFWGYDSYDEDEARIYLAHLWSTELADEYSINANTSYGIDGYDDDEYLASMTLRKRLHTLWKERLLIAYLNQWFSEHIYRRCWLCHKSELVLGMDVGNHKTCREFPF